MYDTHALLEHGSWLRSLARTLVRDAQTADDLVQSTWLRWLERPPRSAGPVRAWLAAVLRNEARMHWRSEGRLTDLEDEPVARARRPDTASEHFEQMRLLMDAVHALDEPFREAVLLRHVEGLPPGAIAARLDVPVRTVESRLRRAHERLRASLDRSFGGERRAWVLAFAPLASGRLPLPGLALGTIAMNAKWIAVAAALVITALAILPEVREDLAEPVGALERTANAPSPEPRPPMLGEGRDVVALAGVDAGTESEQGPVHPASNLVRGRVVDTDAAAVRARVRVLPDGTAVGAPLLAQIDGSFELPHLEGAQWVADASDEWATVLRAPVGRTDVGPRVYVVVAPHRALEGLVVDESGVGIGGAALEVVLGRDVRAEAPLPLEHNHLVTFAASSDGEGRFSFEERAVLGGDRLRASAEGYGSVEVDAPPGDTTALVVTLPPAPTTMLLKGRVLGPGGEVVPGAFVALGDRVVRTGDDGGFRFDDPDPNADRLRAVHAGLLPAEVRASVGPSGRATWPAFLELRLGGEPLSITGLVLGADGAPLPFAGVWVRDLERMGWLGELAVSVEHVVAGAGALWWRVTCDEDGRFTIAGLTDREYALRAMHPVTLDFLDRDRVPAGSDVRLAFPPSPTRRLSGRAVDRSGRAVAGASVHLVRDGFAETTRDGRSWVDLAYGSDASTESDGSFELTLPSRPAEDHRILVYARDFEHGSFAIAEIPEDGTLVLSRLRRVHLDARTLSAQVDGFEARDAAGAPLSVLVLQGNQAWALPRGELSNARATFRVSDAARTIVLVAGDEEVTRVPLVFAPGDGVTEVVP